MTAGQRQPRLYLYGTGMLHHRPDCTQEWARRLDRCGRFLTARPATLPGPATLCLVIAAAGRYAASILVPGYAKPGRDSLACNFFTMALHQPAA